jgi:hypothetical protein
VEIEHENVGKMALHGRESLLPVEATSENLESAPAKELLQAVEDKRMVIRYD